MESMNGIGERFGSPRNAASKLLATALRGSGLESGVVAKIAATRNT